MGDAAKAGQPGEIRTGLLLHFRERIHTVKSAFKSVLVDKRAERVYYTHVYLSHDLIALIHLTGRESDIQETSRQNTDIRIMNLSAFT